MDAEQLKELLADLVEDGLDDLDTVESTRKGLQLNFMSGDQFLVSVVDLGEEEDDDDEEDDDEDD